MTEAPPEPNSYEPDISSPSPKITMPYRRLPNTDQARIRALKMVTEKCEASGGIDPTVSLRAQQAARNFLLKFEAAHAYYVECYARQAQAAPAHHRHVKMARLYVSHFIQVLNLAVIRNEVRAAQKEWYGLPVKSNTVPDLSSEAALAEWGRRVIDGEGKRIAQGGIPIYNPTIAKVKVHYDIFLDSYEKQKSLQAATGRSLEALSAMRAEADRLILDIWNQVEACFAGVEPLGKRLEQCRAYGVVYYYRSGEKNKETEV